MKIEDLVGKDYSLPFDVSKHPIRISQGNNGPWSHHLIKKELPGGVIETDLRFAVDFALPLGSEVLAAKEGIIYSALLGGTWYYEGLDPEIGNHPPPFSWTNQIIIAHADDTLSVYSHLGNRRLVQDQQTVKAGEVIALTGRSGWIAEIPHLHFQVSDSRFSRTIPITFRDYSDVLDHETLAKRGKIWFG